MQPIVKRDLRFELLKLLKLNLSNSLDCLLYAQQKLNLSLYPQDKSECLMGLYNVSLLEKNYTGLSAKIKADIDKISKIVFSTQNDCNPIINYRGWDNITQQCKSSISDLGQIITNYENDIMLGGNGTKYLNSMLLQVQKNRKLCGFNILVKAKGWNGQNCQSANIGWLYPITDQFDTIISSKNYKNFTANFYNLYQSVYRAHDLCVNNNLGEQNKGNGDNSMVNKREITYLNYE